MEVADFERALFEDDVCRVSFNRLVIENRLGTVATQTTNKRAINPCYLKLHVGNGLNVSLNLNFQQYKSKFNHKILIR